MFPFENMLLSLTAMGCPMQGGNKKSQVRWERQECVVSLNFPGKRQEALQDNAKVGNLSRTMGFADSLVGTSFFMISLIWPFPVLFCGAVSIAVSCPFVSFDVFKLCKVDASAMPKTQ